MWPGEEAAMWIFIGDAPFRFSFSIWLLLCYGVEGGEFVNQAVRYGNGPDWDREKSNISRLLLFLKPRIRFSYKRRIAIVDNLLVNGYQVAAIILYAQVIQIVILCIS